MVVPQQFTAAEFEQACREVTAKMAQDVSIYSTPISLSTGHEMVGKHLGTGSFLDLAGMTLLLSCEHVFAKQATNELAHRIMGLDRYVRVNPLAGAIAEPIDAAFTDVSSLAFEEPWCESRRIAVDRLSVLHDAVDGELFFVHGFAAENSQFVYDSLTVNGTAYLCQQVPLPANSRLDSQTHFALGYCREVAIRAFGEHSLPDPRGMSGSLVWNTRFVECARNEKEWSPEYADVAGLLWLWLEEDKIIATRCEYVMSFLLWALANVAKFSPRVVTQNDF